MAGKAVEILLKAKDFATAQIAKVNGRIREIGNASDSSVAGNDRLSGSFAKLTGRLGAFIGAAAGLVAVKGLLQGVFNTGSKFETLKTQLDAVTGSAEAGEQAFAWIKQFAKDTPLQLEDVAQSFVKLKAFGIDPLDGTFQKLVDQSEKLGGGQEKLNGIIMAVGQAWAKQKLQAEETLQLVERGVPVYDLLGKALGKTALEIQEMSAKGELGRDAIKALIDEMGSSSLGAAAAQMENAAGIVSGLKDQFTEFLALIADQGALEYFKGQLAALAATIKKMTDDGSLQRYAKNIANSIITIAETVKGAISTIASFSSELKALALAFVAVRIGGFVTGLYLSAQAMLGLTAATAVATTGFVRLKIAMIQTGIGALIVGAGYLATNLLSVGDAADKTSDKLAEEALKNEKLAKTFQQVAEETGLIITSQEALTAAIASNRITLDEQSGAYSLVEQSAEDAGDAQEEAGEQVRQAAEKMRLLAGATSDADKRAIEFVYTIDEIRNSADGLGKSLKNLVEADFATFATSLNEAIDRGYLYTSDAIQLQNAVMAESFRRLNVDVELFGTGLSTQGREAIAAFSFISSAAQTTGEEIKAAFDAALSNVSTRKGVDELRAQINKLGEDGKISAGMIEVAMDSLDLKIKSINGGLSDVSKNAIDQFKSIASQAELTGGQITVALNDALRKVDGKQAIQGLRDELDRLYRDGKISLNQLIGEVKKLEEAVESTGDAVTVARKALDGIVKDFNTAETVGALNDVGIAASNAWKAGKISAEQYQAVLISINQKKRDLITTILNQIKAEHDLAEAAAQTAAEQQAFQEKVLDNTSRSMVVYQRQREQLKLTGREVRNLGKIEAEMAKQRKAAADEAVLANNQQATMRYFAEYNAIAIRSQIETDKASRAAKELAERVGDVGKESLKTKEQLAAYADELERAIANDVRLDEANFNKLNRSLETVRRNISEVTREADSAASQLADMQRELAQMQGDEAEVQRLDHERRRLTLVSKIEEARAEGNKDALEAYSKSLDLLKKISTMQQQEIAKKNGEFFLGETTSGSRTKIPSSSARGSTTSIADSRDQVVNITFNSPKGDEVTGSFKQNDADKIIGMLKTVASASK